MASNIKDFSRLAIHTMTNKPWSLKQCLDKYAAAGVAGVSVWRNVIEEVGIDEAAKMVRGSGLSVPALVRGGFFPAFEKADRQKAIDDNKGFLDEAAAIGAEMVVLVVGAVPGMALGEARKQVADGIGACVEHAEARGVKLAIEPLHPMYAGDRSAVNTMGQAREICKHLKSEMVGIAVDVYHVWWDGDLEHEIRLAGEMGTLFGFHICDWRLETRDLLNDRGLMGDGCIDIRRIRGWVEETGFDGFNEVEVFSTEYWGQDQDAYLEKIKGAYLENS